MIRPAALIVKPAGKPPAVNVYGLNPPVAVMVALYGVPATASGSVVAVIVNGEAIEIERLALVVITGEDESCTCTVNLEVPAAKGVPEIKPALFIMMPAGSEPMIENV